WFTYARKKLHHIWRGSDYAFPSLTKVPRGASKKRRRKTGVLAGGYSFATVGIKWGSPMSDSNFSEPLNIIAEAAGISRNLLGDEIWLTSHCFRRGGAQYQFMFAPEDRRWSLKLVKWWAGWAPSEKSETVTRYLLDDVLDREENQLGDSLALDAASCSSATLEDRLMSSDLTTADVVAAQNGAGVSLQVVISTIRRADPTSSIIDKNISNRKDAERRAALRGDSPTEFLLKQLETNGLFYKVDVNPDNSRLRSLFWSHPDIQDIYGWNSDVLILDCTYKTNSFDLPLLNIISMTNTNKVLPIAQC
ncbi:hypothetical protein F443_17826, partial [Phytophthora nicotianae P1569]